jgi:hypothetical protein
MSSNTFNPYGPTFARTVTTASTTVVPTLTAPPTALTPMIASMDYRFTNIGTQPVWVAYAYPGVAAPTAVIPTDGTSQTGLWVEPNTTRSFEFTYQTQFACIAASAGSSLYCTIGSGNNG